jgi:hypothetical protein
MDLCRLRLTIVLLAVIALSVAGQAQGSEYTVSQTAHLSASANGIEGNLELLIDARLPADLQKQMWGIGDWSFVLPEKDPRYVAFAATLPLNAVVRIVDGTGRVLEEVTLERPLARLTEAHLHSDRTTFLIDVDYSVGFGSYAGITTQLLDVPRSHLKWEVAENVVTRQVEIIRLPKTLKSDWKFTGGRGTPNILLVLCRPTSAGDGFVIRYVRYRFDGQKWYQSERSRKGLWEADERFPPVSLFP